MIVYDKLFVLLKDRGVSTYRIRKDNIISQGTLSLLKNDKSVTIDTINKLCAVLNCQPGDILDYIPDQSE